MRGLVWLALVTLALITLAGACGGSGGGDDTAVRDALRQMVLQQEDLPQGMQSLGGSFSTNAEAGGGLGAPSVRQLDEWGRILGYKNDFQAAEPSETDQIVAVSTSVSLYKTAAGAAASFLDRMARARVADWRQSHADLQEFQQKEMDRALPADGLLWLRFTGFQQTGPGETAMVSDDQIVFRVDRIWGFLGVVSRTAKGGDDRDVLLPEIETLVRKQIDRIRTALRSGILE